MSRTFYIGNDAEGSRVNISLSFDLESAMFYVVKYLNKSGEITELTYSTEKFLKSASVEEGKAFEELLATILSQ